MSTANVYLNFMWNTMEVFNFYKSVFDWDFEACYKYSDTPANTEGFWNLTDKEKWLIMHISLPILWNLRLMWADVIESIWQKISIWNNFSLSLNVDSKKEALKYFNALSKWWEIQMPIQDAFWWAYFWMCRDKYGIWWMVNYEYPKI